MLDRLLRGCLFDKEPGAGGGQDGIIPVGPGVPYEHDFDAPLPEAPKEKSDVEKRLEALERDNQTLRGRVQQSEDDARFWQRRAGDKPAETRVVVEREPQPEPEPAAFAENPAKFMDRLTTGGLRELVKTGVITQDQLLAELERRDQNIDAKIDAKIDAARSDVGLVNQLDKEFPEMLELSRAIDAGETTLQEASNKSPMWKRAADIYRQNVNVDPNLANSKGALLIACRQAKKELEYEGKLEGRSPNARETRATPARDSRRDRIERQRREPSFEPEGEGEDEGFTGEQTEVMRRLGVKPEEFKRHRDTVATGGRRAR